MMKVPTEGTLRAGLPPLPPRMQKLPLDERGYPVPYFVAWLDGKPDFRVADREKRAICFKHNRCWLCGEPLGVYRAFVIGPMCAVNRVFSEPPSHAECAEFAVQACPFLTLPQAKRRNAHLPAQACAAPGIAIARNPGVTLIWITKTYHLFRAPGGVLCRLGDPERVLWYAEGRPALRAEIMGSIESGLPALEQMARDDGNLPELNRQLKAALKLVPA